jgi:hypothetical protein
VSDAHEVNSVTQFPLSQFLSDPNTQQPDFLVDGVFPERSITLLTAQPSAGKSVLAMSMLLQVGRGEPFAGLKTKQAPVLFIGEDGPPWDYANIARKFLGGEPAPETFFAWIKKGFRLDDPERCEQLKRDAKTAGVKGIVLDSFRFVHRGDENKSDEMQTVMNTTRDIAEETGAGILLVHHPSKPNAMGGASDFRGSSVILASSDFHFHVSSRKLKGESARALAVSCEKGRCASTPDDLRLLLSWGDKWVRIEPNDAAQFVVESLLANERLRASDLAEKLRARNGGSVSTCRKVVDQALRTLQATDTVEKEGDKKNGFWWSMKPSGN